MKIHKVRKVNGVNKNQKRVLYFSIVFLLLIAIGALMGLFIGKLTGFFALENATYVAPTLTSMNASTVNNWVYVNITADEDINMSILEWANSSGLTNLTMSNYSLSVWYLNMTNLADGNYNYTVITQNKTYTDNISYVHMRRKFVAIDTVAPYVNITYPANTTYNVVGVNSINWTINEPIQGVWYSLNDSANISLANITTQHILPITHEDTYSVYPVDIDLDGDMDFVYGGGPMIAMCQNNGAEVFTETNITAEPFLVSQTKAVYSSDIDSDGDIDVLTGGNTYMYWLENNGAQSFTRRTITAGGSTVYDVYATDVDSDGDVDALMASYSDDRISWYGNNGQVFTEANISTNADGAISVYATDVDSDGDVDVLSASRNDNTIAWYDNNGAESFTKKAITISDNNGPYDVYATDVDSDGDVDVLGAFGTSNRIAWYENNGTEGFTEHNISTSVTIAWGIYATDVDGDNDVDVIGSSYTDNQILWYENNGTEGFTGRIVGYQTNARNVHATDVDGDGDVDLMAASSDLINSDVIAWYEANYTNKTIATGDGTNTFIVSAKDRAGNINSTTVVFTYVPDNTPPVITINKPQDTPNNLTNDNTPALNASIDETGTIWYQLDHNGTNITGCASCTSFEINFTVLADGFHNVTVYANDTSGNANSTTRYFTVDTTAPVVIINLPAASPNNLTNDTTPALKATIKETGTIWYQLDHNGTNITVCASCKNFSVNLSTLTAGYHNITVWANDSLDNKNSSTRYFTVDTTSVLISLTSIQNTSYATLSFNLSYNIGEHVQGVWYNLNNGQNIPLINLSTEHNVSAISDGAISVYAIDVDGDYDMDIVRGLAADTIQKVSWFRNNGVQSFTKIDISSSTNGISGVFAIDLDLDSDIDVLSASSIDDRIAWYSNNGAQVFTEHNITIGADGAQAVYAIDVDGDYDIDILSASSNDDRIAWYENNGNEVFTEHNITIGADGAREVYAIDVDSDSDIDVLSASSVGSSRFAWFENNGAETFTEHNISFTTANGAQDIYATDIDLDGDVDVLTAWAGDDNTIAWYENNGNEVFTEHNLTRSAYQARSVYATDVDSDGDVDVLSTYWGDHAISFLDGIVSWFENNGTQNFTEHNITTNTMYDTRAVYAEDIDTDGDIDVLCGSLTDPGSIIKWFEANQTNTTITAQQCSNRVVISAKDKAGNINSTTVVFTADNVTPTISSFTCTPTSVIQGDAVTCACSTTDNCGTPTTVFTANPSTASTGTFTETCTATDNSSNSVSATATYTVNPGGGEEPPEECENECNRHARECIDENSFKTCGNYDEDECLEWSGAEACESGKVCKIGHCVRERECIPNWLCREWSECRFRYDLDRAGSLIERICEDANKCEPNTIETEDCNLPTAEVETIVEPSPSGGGYIGIYDKKTKNKVAGITQGEREGIPFVDVELYTIVEEAVSKELISEVIKMPVSAETPAATIRNYANAYLRWIILIGLIAAFVAYVLPKASFIPFARRIGQETKSMIEKEAPLIRQFMQKAEEEIKKEVAPAKAKTLLELQIAQKPKPELIKTIQKQFAESNVLKVPKPEIKPEKIDRKISSIKEQLKEIEEEEKRLKK